MTRPCESRGRCAYCLFCDFRFQSDRLADLVHRLAADEPIAVLVYLDEVEDGQERIALPYQLDAVMS
jgi:predicted AAA+ superfamily ATPase